uniref:Uncharacterized protein n=1 Tax=viral metagenome TaxID=1070528 RepID=A0A6C0JP52_9ZZZZ
MILSIIRKNISFELLFSYYEKYLSVDNSSKIEKNIILIYNK